jgi:hypothetical protein
MYAITIVETGRVAILELLPDIRLFKYLFKIIKQSNIF